MAVVTQWTIQPLPAWREPADLFDAYAVQPYCVWLDSAMTGAQGNFSILAASPFQVFRATGDTVSIESADDVRTLRGNPFDLLKAELARYRHRQLADPSFPVGAAIGYFGYDLKNQVERLPSRAVNDLGLPDCWFGFYDRYLVFDHRAQNVYEVSQPGSHRPVTAASRDQHIQRVTTERRALHSNFTRAEYCRAVGRVRDYIAAGDVYQVNLSQRFQCDVAASAPDLYRALRVANPAPYSAYLDMGSAQVLSSSPECFLNMNGRAVATRPIKGTRRRTGDTVRDRQIAEELLRAPKDNAELVMITDLERNDLGRVCAFGSVRVSDLVRVESFATVLHLVSTVEGRLREGVSHVDEVRACFPGGSITGAPKIRAMEIIDELEPHARGVYCGAIGFLGFNEVSHLNIAIRTLVYRGGEVTFHAGGGIVIDSAPEAEYEETLAKAEGIIHAIDQLRVCERAIRP
jgi:para-aminobenzoate synthetase component 1